MPLPSRLRSPPRQFCSLRSSPGFCSGAPLRRPRRPVPTPVGVIVVREQPVPLTAELPGRTSPYETSDVRPQVDGIIRARLFTEGDYVRAGQPLYRIDPATYEARVANARAALARARASTIAAEGQVKRYAELVKRNFVSRQLYDNALSAAGEARADVEAQAAALRSAQIDLDRTIIRAPDLRAASAARSIPPARWSRPARTIR